MATGMERLVASGLAGRGLTKVGSPVLVSRYNDALKALGLTPTALTSFFVDGMGWSPEIAKEKGDSHYLLDGSAHQFAIIISPDQRNKPSYVQYATYERRLMRSYFLQFQAEIADVTATHPLVLDIDQEVLRYQSPRDLLLVEDVVVRSHAGSLLKAASAQKRLVTQLLGDEAWADQTARAALIENARQYGDLRKRKVAIGEFKFADLTSFYTEAFGGVFVFRRKRDRMLVLCDEGSMKDLSGIPGTDVYFIGAQELPEVLRAKGFVDNIDLTSLRERNPRSLEDLSNCLVANYVFKADPAATWETMTDIHRRRIVGMLPKPETELLRELELLRRTLQSSHAPLPSVGSLSPALQLLLLQPMKGVPTALKETVVALLARLRKHDPLELYTADKNRFFVHYGMWPEGKQSWAVDRIVKNYKAVMDT
jgi:hypothetical protein